MGWDQMWLEVAALVGRRSRCSRAQYGAVIVSDDNRVLSVGYNGYPPASQERGSCDRWCARSVAAANGDPVDPDYLDCHAIHAEANALLRSDALFETTAKLYVNGVTCLRCALLIAGSGIRQVHLLVTPYEQKRNPGATAELLRQYNVGVLLHYAT